MQETYISSKNLTDRQNDMVRSAKLFAFDAGKYAIDLMYAELQKREPVDTLETAIFINTFILEVTDLLTVKAVRFVTLEKYQ